MHWDRILETHDQRFSLQNLRGSLPMRSTLIHCDGYDWIIVGSNGFIGAALTRALAGREIDRSRSRQNIITHIEHEHDQYLNATYWLLQNNDSGRPCKLLFCAGKGGFSLLESQANQQYRVFERFSNAIGDFSRIHKVVLISSLGAHCSRIESPYRTLIEQKEACLDLYLPAKSLILRLPSMYGSSQTTKTFHGLIGVMYQKSRLGQSTEITATLRTRRNYLSINRLATIFSRPARQHDFLNHLGIVNVQASYGLSIHEICASFFQAMQKRPRIVLKEPRLIDAEDHFPFRLQGARLILDDNLSEWIKWQQNLYSLPFLS